MRCKHAGLLKAVILGNKKNLVGIKCNKSGAQNIHARKQVLLLLYNNLLKRKSDWPSNFEELESECGWKSIYVCSEFICRLCVHSDHCSLLEGVLILAIVKGFQGP